VKPHPQPLPQKTAGQAFPKGRGEIPIRGMSAAVAALIPLIGNLTKMRDIQNPHPRLLPQRGRGVFKKQGLLRCKAPQQSLFFEIFFELMEME
jgi:hypothetical protein